MITKLAIGSIAFFCASCDRDNTGQTEGFSGGGGSQPEWISEFNITERIRISDFDQKHFADIEEPIFIVTKVDQSTEVWRFRRPFPKTDRHYLYPGDRVCLYLDLPDMVDSHRGNEGVSHWRSAYAYSNVATDILPIPPYFVRNHLIYDRSNAISGYRAPGEGDVMGIVSFSSPSFEQSLAKLEVLAEEGNTGGLQAPYKRVYKTPFSPSAELQNLVADIGWEIDPASVQCFKFSCGDNSGYIVMDRATLRAAFHEEWL